MATSTTSNPTSELDLTVFSMATSVYNKLDDGDQTDYCENWYTAISALDTVGRTIDKKDLSRYVKFKRKQYAEYDICDDELADAFHFDFKLFTLREISAVHQLDARQLRNLLRSKGVNIPLLGMEVQHALYDQAQRKDSIPWTEQQIKELLSARDSDASEFPSWNIKRMIKNMTEITPVRHGTNPDNGPGDEGPNRNDMGRGNKRDRSDDGKDRKAFQQYAPNALLNFHEFYSPEEKYSGDDDDFDYKLSIFYDISRRAELPNEQFCQAFPMMLRGGALGFYHSSRSNLPTDFKRLCAYIKREFEGDEAERNMLNKWNSITLLGVKAKNKDKTLSESFHIMAVQLRNLQMRLQKEMRDPVHLHNKLMVACQGVPACNLACLNPAKSVPVFIQQLKQAIAVWERSHKGEDSTFFVDRRFQRGKQQ